MASARRDSKSHLFDASQCLAVGDFTKEHDPYEITIFDPLEQVTKLKYYARDQSGKFKVDEESIVIAIDRASGIDKHGKEKVTFSLYFGPNSRHNYCISIPKTTKWGSSPRTNHTTELDAFEEAVDWFCFTGLGLGLFNPIIMTRSSYIAKGFSEHITKWQSNGWKDNKGRDIKNARAFDYIDQSLKTLSYEDDVDAKIWLVSKDQNCRAAALAKEAMACYPRSCFECGPGISDDMTGVVRQIVRVEGPDFSTLQGLDTTSSLQEELVTSMVAQQPAKPLPYELYGCLLEETSTLGGYFPTFITPNLANAMPCFQFWVFKARYSPEVRQLCSRLEIRLPMRQPFRQISIDIVAAIRRLVVVGEDRPENFAILYGPQWANVGPQWGETPPKSTEIGHGLQEFGIRMIWIECRLQVLLCPPPNSIAHIVGEGYDRTAPRWTPRGPSAAEEEMLRVMKAGEVPTLSLKRDLAAEYGLQL